MRGRPEWRKACVIRAQTIAANVRMIEFAVEGELPAFGQGARTRVQGGEPGAVISSYICLHVGQGRMRVLVAGRDDGRASSRFMWSLVEGARVRLTVPSLPQRSRRAVPPRIAGRVGIRVAFAGGPLREISLPRTRFGANVANGNVSVRGHSMDSGREGRPDAR